MYFTCYILSPAYIQQIFDWLLLAVIFLMHTLDHQISNFKQQIEALQIAHYTSLFQLPKQQETTLQQVLLQNNFIIQSMKMMNKAFLNYCWLNERVYAKIAEHQLSLHDQKAKLATLTHRIDHRLDDSVRTFKTMYEDSLVQNRKNKEIVQVGLKSICEQIHTKVNDTQLTEKIKEILMKYDQGDLLGDVKTEEPTHITEYGYQPQLRQTHMLRTSSSGERKVGKVAYEDHYRLKDEIQYHFAKINKRIHDLEHQSHQNKEKISKHAVILDRHQESINRNKSDISQLRSQHNNASSLILEQIERTNTRVDERLSQQEWKRRFSLFQMKSLDPLKMHINDCIHQIRGDLKKVKEETYFKTNSTESSLSQMASQLKDFKAKVVKEVEDIAVLELKFNQIDHKFNHDSLEIHKITDGFMQQAKKRQKQLQKNLKKELNDLKTSIHKLSNTVEEKAFKVLAKKIESSFQAFEVDLMQSREIVKSLTLGVSIANEQISNIKEVLSRKANFSDVVHYVESKADKHDIRELKNKMNQSNPQNAPLLLRQLSDTVHSKIQSNLIESPKRFKSITKPRTEFVSHPATQRGVSRSKSNKNTIDLQGTARKLLIRENKHRINKSYSSLINDLRN